MTTVIEVDGLTKRYGHHVAVDDVGFGVTEGEIFGILGTNGAGKTTTVECLQGLRRPDRGRMRVLGYDPRTAGGRLRALVGSQLQSSALPDRLRVDEAVRLFGNGDRRSAERLLETWDLTALRRSSFASLSGGQRQRLFIALALLNEPRVVFFDELTQGLDPLARGEVWAAIRDVRDRGTTVVLVTHFMDEAEALCDRVAIIERGRVVALDTPAGLRRRLTEGVRIAFRCDRPLDLARVRALDGVRLAEARDGAYELVVADPTAPLHEVTGQALAAGTALHDLSVTGASLEEVFLQLTADGARS